MNAQSKHRVLFISDRFRHTITCGSDQRLYGLLKSLLAEYQVTWIANEEYGKTEANKYFFPDDPGLTAIQAPMPKRTIVQRLINRIGGVCYEYLGEARYDDAMKVNSLKKTLAPIDLTQYSFILLFYLAHPAFISYLRTHTGRNRFIVIDTIDVQFERLKKLYFLHSRFYFYVHSLFLKRIEAAEKKALLMADCLIAISKSDEEYFIKTLRHPQVVYCSSGMEVAEFMTPDTADSREILFFGAMNGISNIQAVQYFKEKIFPLVLEKVPDAQFIIVGSNPGPDVLKLADEHTRITGYVKDANDYLRKAKCLVCPLQVSYGQRVRVLEAIAQGLPVVVTPQAVEGMGLENVKGVFIEDDDKKYSDRVAELLLNEFYRRSLQPSLITWAKENISLRATYHELFKRIEVLRGSKSFNN